MTQFQLGRELGTIFATIVCEAYWDVKGFSLDALMDQSYTLLARAGIDGEDEPDPSNVEAYHKYQEMWDGIYAGVRTVVYSWRATARVCATPNAWFPREVAS